MIIIDVLEFLFLVSNKFIMRYLFVTVLNISEFAFHNNFQYSSCMLCNCLNGNELMSFWIYSFHSTRWNKAESSKQNEFIPIFFFWQEITINEHYNDRWICGITSSYQYY